MKEKLIQLIHNYNTPQQGINSIPDIPNYVDKLLKNATIIPIINQKEVQKLL